MTITGGKTTTFRLMAEVAVDAVCAQLGVERPCRTHEEPLPDSEDGSYYELGSRLRAREPVHSGGDHLRVRAGHAAAARGGDEAAADGEPRRHPTHAAPGNGPLPGGFCIYGATGILHAVERLDQMPQTRLTLFLQERWKGRAPILYGDQLRQARLDDWIFQGLLGIQRLPHDLRHGRDRRRPRWLTAACGWPARANECSCRQGSRLDASAPATIDVLGFADEALTSGAGAAEVRRSASRPSVRAPLDRLIAASIEWFKGACLATEVSSTRTSAPDGHRGGEALGGGAGDDGER